MRKNYLFIPIIVLALCGMLLSTTRPVTALGASTPTPQSVYVDKSRTDGNEDGTQNHPYNKFDEGEAYAQSLDYGGYLYLKDQPNGTYEYYGKYKPVTAMGGGIGLPTLTVYFLLTVLAIILILAGRQLQRRSHHIQK